MPTLSFRSFKQKNVFPPDFVGFCLVLQALVVADLEGNDGAKYLKFIELLQISIANFQPWMVHNFVDSVIS